MRFTPPELVAWVREWCVTTRARILACQPERQTVSLVGVLAELADLLPAKVSELGKVRDAARYAAVSVSRIDSFAAEFEAAVAAIGIAPLPPEPRYVGQDGKPYTVRVLPNCIALTGPDGVSKFVWHDATGKLKGDPSPPKPT